MEQNFTSIETYLKYIYGKEIPVRYFENIDNNDYERFEVHLNHARHIHTLYQPAVFSNDKGTTFFAIMSFRYCYEVDDTGMYCTGNFDGKYFKPCPCMIKNNYLNAKFKILKLDDVWKDLPDFDKLTVYEENPAYVYEKYGAEAREWYFKTRKELNMNQGVYDDKIARKIRREKRA